METTSSSETAVGFQRITQSYIPEDGTLPDLTKTSRSSALLEKPPIVQRYARDVSAFNSVSRLPRSINNKTTPVEKQNFL
jgi:hypothetical protein